MRSERPGSPDVRCSVNVRGWRIAGSVTRCTVRNALEPGIRPAAGRPKNRAALRSGSFNASDRSDTPARKVASRNEFAVRASVCASTSGTSCGLAPRSPHASTLFARRSTNNQRAKRYAQWQFRFLIIGAICFLAWHVGGMYERGQTRAAPAVTTFLRHTTQPRIPEARQLAGSLAFGAGGGNRARRPRRSRRRRSSA